ncbi:MAG: patatin family protein [bacterium]|nr:patatin family protein [bacterium]
MENKRNRKALVVEGGAMRGVFAAGVLNAFGNAGFDPFDLYIGVSAGACNLASYLGEQYTRNYDLMERYSTTPRFISKKRFLLGGHLMDLDWLWEITISEYRLNLKKIISKKQKDFYIVATSMETGNALYLKPEEDNLEHYLKVSSSLPFLYRKILEVDSEKATDGGVADSIPVIEAYNRGASSIMVIRSRHGHYIKKKSRFPGVYSLLFKKYPAFAEALKKRSEQYMKSLEFIKDPPRDVRIIEVVPPDSFSTGRITKDLTILRKDYELGKEKGMTAISNFYLNGGR